MKLVYLPELKMEVVRRYLRSVPRQQDCGTGRRCDVGVTLSGGRIKHSRRVKTNTFPPLVA